jgi:hypothetical protein
MQDVIFSWQRNAIISLPVGSNPRDLFFVGSIADDQQIFRIVLHPILRGFSPGKLNLFSETIDSK